MMKKFKVDAAYEMAVAWREFAGEFSHLLEGSFNFSTNFPSQTRTGGNHEEQAEFTIA